MVKVRVNYSIVLELDVKEVPGKFIRDLEEWFKFASKNDDGLGDGIADIMMFDHIEEVGPGSIKYGLRIDVDGKTVVNKDDLLKEGESCG